MKMRKMMATVITVALALSTMSMSALAAQKASIEGGDAGLVLLNKKGKED
jgi:Spy/CpxP family protein refolding chaperone